MKTVMFLVTLSLVMWLTLSSNEKQKEIDEEEVFKEILDRGKWDAMPRPSKHFYIWLYALSMLRWT